MKKIALLSILLLLLPAVSYAETYLLKLRSSRHPDFLRIVFEGTEDILRQGSVNQAGQNVLVTFRDADFSIQAENVNVAYKKAERRTVVFSPGDYRGLKVSNLKDPARLVIDIYMEENKAEPLAPTKVKERDVDLFRIKSVVIDPGHGGYDDGIVKNNYKEKNIVLDIAKQLCALINKGASRCYLTRGSDLFLSMSERVKTANGKNADIFISLHVGNHSDIAIYSPVITEYVPDTVKHYLENKGQEDYEKDSETLLIAVKEAVGTDFGKDRISARAIPYSIMSRIEAAALLIEFPSFEDTHYIEELKTEIANTLYKGLYIYEGTRTK